MASYLWWYRDDWSRAVTQELFHRRTAEQPFNSAVPVRSHQDDIWSDSFDGRFDFIVHIPNSHFDAGNHRRVLQLRHKLSHFLSRPLL